MREIIVDSIGLAGMLAVIVAAWMVNASLGLAVLGVILVLFAWLGSGLAWEDRRKK